MGLPFENASGLVHGALGASAHAGGASSGPAICGHHWLLDLSGCQAEMQWLECAAQVQYMLPQLARDAGMQVVTQAFHQFEPSGVTGAVVLAESHVTIHTWPETQFVAIDVYVCDFQEVNRSKGQRLSQSLIALYQPLRVNFQEVQRNSCLGAL